MNNEQLKQTIMDKLAAFPNSPQINDVVELVKQIGGDPQPAQIPECFKSLLEHAHGMSRGVDWNKGTAAGFHREKLIAAVKQCKDFQPQPALADQPRLMVQVRSFPESNGKRNWTALITRVDKWGGLIGNCGGITVAHGEFWNRVAYHAETVKFLLGQRDTEPHILDYGDDLETPYGWLGEVRGGIPLRKTGKPEITNSGRQLPDVSTPTPMPPVKQPKSAQVPDGWKLVPIEPTQEMLEAGSDAWDSRFPTSSECYASMLTASPAPEVES